MFGFENHAKRLGWITLSKTNSLKENSAAITINLEQGYDGYNTLLWIVDTHNHIIVPVPFSATNSFQYKGLPFGQSVTVFAISTDANNNWNFAQSKTEIKDNTLNLTLKNSSLQEIRDAIINL